MDISRFVRFDQGRVEVTVFDPVTTTTIKVTGSTCGPAGGAYAKGDFFEINRFKNLCSKFLFFIRGIAAACWEFFIGAGGIMAYKAIYILFR